MEELKDVSMHHTAIKLADDIKNLKIYNNLYKTVQKLACSPEVDKDDMKVSLEAAIKENGLETDIRNIVFHLIRSQVKQEIKSNLQPTDALSYLRRAGVQWERRVRKSLNAMCTELKAPLQGQLRSAVDKEDLVSKWDELSNYQTDLTNYRPVYAPKDLLEVLLSLKGPPRKDDDEMLPKWEFSHISLPVKNLFSLRHHFGELLRNETPVDWNSTCVKVLATRHAPLCQHVLKKAVTPNQLRGALWSYVLGSQIEPHVSQIIPLV